MTVTRLALPGRPIAPGAVRVPPPAARHARVARVAAGDAVEVVNLAGAVGIGRLSRWEAGSCGVEIERVENGRGEPPAPLVLGLGILHTQAFDWAVEKATELGATAVVPLLCGRVQGGRHGARVARWQRIADAAVAQCGRSRSPGVAEPLALAAFIASTRGVRLVAEPGAPLPEARSPGPEGLTVLVGPEGGFADDEAAAIHAAGFVALPLGRRTLRAETAVLAALTLAQALAGWLR